MEDKKGFIITIVVLILLILGLGGYIAYDYVQDQKQAAKKTTIIKNTTIDLNVFYQISDTLDSFDKAFNNPKSLYIGYIYVPKKLTAAKFDMGAAIYASMIQDMTVSGPPKPYFVPEEKVKYNFERIFGRNLEYEQASVQSGEVYKVAFYNRGDPPIRYDYYAPIEENVYSEKYIAINYKTELEEDKVIINRRIFYAQFVLAEDGANYSGVRIYKDHNKSTLIGELNLKNGYINENEILSKYGSKLLKYKYTFVKDKGDKYSFYSIETTK